MDININITFGLNQEAKDFIMSTLSDKIAQLSTHVDSATTRIQADIANLNSQITALQTQIASGGATADDLAALDALQAKLDAIDPATATVVPTPTPTPAPTGPPTTAPPPAS